MNDDKATGEDEGFVSDRAQRLLKKFSATEFEQLWLATRARLERTEGNITRSPLHLSVEGSAREAIAGIVGISHGGAGPLLIRLDLLDERIVKSMGVGLVQLVEELGGPLANPKAARRSAVAERESAWTMALDHEALFIHPVLETWIADLQRTGKATRIAGGVQHLGSLLERTLDAIRFLPGQGIQLATLASRVAGDPHALDRGRPLGTLVSSALAWLDGEQADDPEGAHAVGNTTRSNIDGQIARESDVEVAAVLWRRRWERVGVVCDDLSTSVLVFGLSASAATNPLEESVARACAAGLPLRLTLFELSQFPLHPDQGLVSVCENPSVVREAILRGVSDLPLICTEGQPNSAFDAVARACVEAGSNLRYHGDFDWGGIRIANGVMSRYGAEPWHYSMNDYIQVADRLIGGDELTAAPEGLVASWDEELVTAMTTAGVRVYEEQVLDVLMSTADENSTTR